MISMMGLATGIDYSLFIVSRFREERARGRDKIDAIARRRRHRQPRGAVQRPDRRAGAARPAHRADQHLREPRHRRHPGGRMSVARRADAAARGARPARRPREQPAAPVPRQAAHRQRAPRATSWIARVAQRAMRRPARRWSSASASCCCCAVPGARHEDRRLGREHVPQQLPEQARPSPCSTAVLVGSVSPAQIVVDGASAGAAVKAGDRPAHGRARSRPGLRPAAGAGRQDGRPRAALGAGERRPDGRPRARTRSGSCAARSSRKAFGGQPASVYVTGADRRQPRLHRHRQQLLPVGHRARPRPELRAAAGRLPLRRHPG